MGVVAWKRAGSHDLLVSHRTHRRDTRRFQLTRDGDRAANVTKNRAGRHGCIAPKRNSDQFLESTGSPSTAREHTRLPVAPDQEPFRPHGHREPSDPNETPRRLRRLLSPEEAAAYLGLGSRFAIYRLVSSGQLRAVRLANKLRLDLRDLDGTIEQAKGGASLDVHRPGGLHRPRIVPSQLAPLRHRKKSVTAPVTAISTE
jgi:excisionase family DNA binding protein